MTPEANDSQPPVHPPLWSGLEEYMDSPAFRQAMENEFPEDASEWTDPVSRRNFLTIMGASLALAGAAGCSPRPAPSRQIVPYTRQPEQMTPGVPLYFATAVPVAGYTMGVLVRSNEGRPTKIEGNPDHPASLGGTDVFTQAAILDLYDPDRSKDVTKIGQGAAYDDAIAALRRQLFDAQGQPKAGVKLRILTGTVTSPTLADQLTALLNSFPEARWAQHEPCGRDNAREGTRKAFGRPLNVTYDFTKADVVLSLDGDFLGSGPGHARYCRDFASRRKVRQSVPAGQENQYVTADKMSRLYVVECMPTTSGSVADHRLALPSSQVDAFARALAAKLGVSGLGGSTLPELAQKWIDPLAADLQRTKGRCVVVAGDHQPPHVHALVAAMNDKLGAVGQTVMYTAPIEVRPDGKVIDLATLVKEMADKKVDALVVLGGTNPAYTAPADIDFAAAIKNVPFRFHFGTHPDETAVLCEWHVNEAHCLETWGDGRAYDGTVTIQQPLIAPLHGGRSAIELLAHLTRGPFREGREIVQAYWKKRFADSKQSGEFEAVWQEWVRGGVVPGTAAGPEKPTLGKWSEGAPAVAAAPSGDDYEINFRPDPTLFDGRFANNGWLQELPKPVTKLSWDNAAYVSPKTAEKLKLEKEYRWTGGEHGRTEVSVVTLEFKGRKVKAPVWILPGHPDNAVTVHLGFGRERAGRVATPGSDQTGGGRLTLIAVPQGELRNVEGKLVHGFNAYALRTSDALHSAAGLKMTKTGDTFFLACTQAQWVASGTKDPLTGKPLERRPVRSQTIEDYKKNPDAAKVPPTSAGETDAIAHNVPGPAGKGEKASGTQGRQGTEFGPGHDHGHDGKDHDHGEDHGHDGRLLPLTMYHPNDNLYPGTRKENQRRWGMAIDLSACTGCNACVIACQAENNTPVVGKREVTRGHEMYWIRIDRYYEGELNSADLKTYFQPVPCQQCEKAPCEVVCPVGATAHTNDGLNDMVYNRCVGTRYCSNNCPYKVRRFNFLTFQDWFTESLKLGRNPDVTVRSRGVMEKCTYCVQRIRYAEIVAERESRNIREGEVKTACQSACPSAAISFGDLNLANSTVGEWKGQPQNYGLMAELNTMPRTSYLATLRNPNPEMK